MYKLRVSTGEQVTGRSACTEPDWADARLTLADALMAPSRSACTELGVGVATVLE